jgi:hypothetical protein
LKIVNLIDFVGDVLQSIVTYVYIGSRMQLLESDRTKSFLNKRNFKPYSDSTLSVKTGPSEMGNRTIQFFATSASCLILFYLGPLMPFSPSSCFKTPWIFKSPI